MAEAAALDEPYSLSDYQRSFFTENGYVKLKAVFSAGELRRYRDVIAVEVDRRNTRSKPMAERTTYEKAFLQVTNLWRTDDVVRELVFSRRLARLAAQLMGVCGVRLYHDQALCKEAGGGITPWHADQFYWPLSSEHTCTAWIPLQKTDVEMGPMVFAARSHRFELGRDLEIGDESERLLSEVFAARRFPEDDGPYDMGDVSFHYGWTLHHTGPNQTSRPRSAMTIIYMEDGMRLAPAQRRQHLADREAFMPGVEVGDVIKSPLNPVLWPQRS